jgi:hypothetical protein
MNDSEENDGCGCLGCLAAIVLLILGLTAIVLSWKLLLWSIAL